MKFMLILSVVFMTPGFVQRETQAGYVWPTRAACEGSVFDVDRKLRKIPGIKTYVDQFDCIQIEGPVPKFPVLEKIAEGWDRT